MRVGQRRAFVITNVNVDEEIRMILRATPQQRIRNAKQSGGALAAIP